MKALARFVAVALLLAIGNARGEEARPVANPTLLPGALMNMRGGEDDKTQLRLTFDRFRDREAEAPLKVWIGSDYFALFEGDRETIYDLRLRRRLIVDRGAQSLINLSLYGDIIFRQIELTRRIEIGQVVARDSKDQALPEPLKLFWIESEVGLPEPGAPPVQIDETGDASGAAHFAYRGQEVAAATFGSDEVPRALLHSYRAFFHHRLPLHPRIAGAVAAFARVPVEIDFISQARGKVEAVTFKLRDAQVAAGDFPLPPGLSLVLIPAGGKDPDVVLLQRLLPNMVDAIGNRAGAGPARTIAGYRAAIDAALKAGQGFEAALLISELALQAGRGAASCEAAENEGPCHPKGEIDKALAGDPRAAALFKALTAQPREPEKAIAILRGLSRSDVRDGFVIDIFLARLLSVRGDRDGAARSFAAAFAGNPYIASLYRDLGDHYARASRTDLAWLAYDIGRALPDRRTPDALSSIDQLEEGLAKQYPELF